MLTPEAVGLPRGTRRLTPGLRREEVATLADVGLTWYTWLEQGRDINVSAAALTRIARALSLSATDETYLFALMGLSRTEVTEHHFTLPPVTQQVLDLYQAPAFVLDTVFNLLAWNRLAGKLYDLGEFSGPFADNHIWNAFMNPARRRLYPDFENGALNLLGMFRMNYAAHPEDTRFDHLIAALTAASPEFVTLWQRCHTAPLSAIIVPFFHPDFGDLSIHSMRMPIRDEDHLDRATAFFFAPADAPTATSFARMAQRLGGG
jgi:transcriptional regulator with XRE-family HTH domain